MSRFVRSSMTRAYIVLPRIRNIQYNPLTDAVVYYHHF